MANILMVNAPPSMYDDFESLIAQRPYCWTRVSRDSEIRGVRRKDTAIYELSNDGTRVRVIIERRLGNPSMHIAVSADHHSLWRADVESDQLAEQVIEFLLANGAYESA